MYRGQLGALRDSLWVGGIDWARGREEQTLHDKILFLYSMLHTTVVPAVLKGGFKLKVFPAEAEAEISVRALPDEDSRVFCAQMAKIIDDSSVTILRLI
jgi:acetylornithine deacetylase/succinyl-diaminopimelate desuccinylase-like protein